MTSKSLPHFPQISFNEEEKLLWNPILKKGFKNLPEERIRLKLVEYLIYEAKFSKNRISFETAVHLPRDKSRSRTDLICYDKDFNALLLVECKAPEVRLDAKVALQIARYNQEVNAPFLMVTNGKSDYWFTKVSDTLLFLDKIPSPFKPTASIDQNFEYWAKRGFIGKNSNKTILNWIVENCTDIYSSSKPTIQFFSFEGTSPELGLPNYYRIYPTGENTKLALSFTSTPIGATKVNAVLNHDGENISLLSISLDLVIAKESNNSTLQSVHGFHQLDILDEIGFSFDRPLNSFVLALSDLML